MSKRMAGGFTLIEIMIVVAIIGIIAAVAIPNFMRARKKSQEAACIANRRVISEVIEQWALASGNDLASQVSVAELLPYFQGNHFPVCPLGGTYTWTDFAASGVVNCSIHSAQRATENVPGPVASP